MQLTTRDIAVITFINDFGFCEIRHIAKQFKMTQSNAYALMNRLCNAGLVVHRRIYYQRPGVYMATKSGAKLTKLSPVSKVAENIYEHHLLVIDVFQKITQLYPTSKWTSERWLTKDKFANGFSGRKPHIADGLVALPELDKPIAVEVELTQKGQRRLQLILNSYITHSEVGDVWYFCTDQTLEWVRRCSVKMPFIKLYQLREFLSESEK